MSDARSPVNLGAAVSAKQLCSAVFVAGRHPQEAVPHCVLPEIRGIHEPMSYVVDNIAKTATVTLGSFTRVARFCGSQGCVIIPEGADDVCFDPVDVDTSLPAADTQQWPMGDVGAAAAPDADVDAAAIEEAVELAFRHPDAKTAAFLVAHRGRIIAERYADGCHADVQLESWSMGKSLIATLVGLLVEDGSVGLDDPAPIPAWRGADDPRAAITVANLLHMSSGLEFSAQDEPDGGDHSYVYSGAVDVFDLAISRRLEHPPNTVCRYRNCDPLALGYIVRRIVEGRGEEYLSFPQRALFDRVGIRKMVPEVDPFGNFIMTGYMYGTARAWLRLGLLYLWGGVWEGARILPDGWSDFVTSRAPAAPSGGRGAMFTLPGARAGLPPDAYAMRGAGDNDVSIVPSRDLVIVRMGHLSGWTPEEACVRPNEIVVAAAPAVQDA